MNRYLIAVITAAVLAGIVLGWLVVAAGFQAIGLVFGAILNFILILIPGGNP